MKMNAFNTRIVLVVALLWLVLSGCGDKKKPEELSFPPDFMWGTATAGFQVDMGCPSIQEGECVDHRSDWYQWVTDPELIADSSTHLSGDPVSYGPGHYELFETDFDLIVSRLNNNAFRMSLEWSRIFPTSTIGLTDPADVANVADATAVAHYHRVLDAMHARGITPLVTLHHYTLPLWLHDGKGCHQDIENCSPAGWLDPDVLLPEMAKYAAFAAAEFGSKIDLWATLNEPFAVLLSGFLMPGADRTNPPGVLMAFAEGKVAAAAMIDAHARMYDAVHENDTEDADGDGAPCQVGLVYNLVPVRPANPDNPDDVEAAENVDYLYNRVFLNATIHGELDENLDGQTVYRDDLDGRMDYLGINYYTRITVEGAGVVVLPELSPLATFDPFTIEMWEDYPRGLYEVIMTGHSYNVPIIITENGKPVEGGPAGMTAEEFIVRHLTWVSRAVADGADVRGYFYWSLMDNYEWNHGMHMKFGLFAVDPLDPQKERTARPAADVYGSIAAANRIPADLFDLYPEPR